MPMRRMFAALRMRSTTSCERPEGLSTNRMPFIRRGRNARGDGRALSRASAIDDVAPAALAPPPNAPQFRRVQFRPRAADFGLSVLRFAKDHPTHALDVAQIVDEAVRIFGQRAGLRQVLRVDVCMRDRTVREKPNASEHALQQAVFAARHGVDDALRDRARIDPRFDKARGDPVRARVRIRIAKAARVGRLRGVDAFRGGARQRDAGADKEVVHHFARGGIRWVDPLHVTVRLFDKMMIDYDEVLRHI